MIEAAGPACVAVKPQLACFERLGAPGWAALAEVCGAAQRAGLLVVADGKRGDVPVTAKAYGQAPSKGDVTAVQLATGDGTTTTDSTHTYDTYGRETSETDAVGTKSVTTYTPTAGAPATEITETNQLGHVDRTLLEPAWGEPVAEIDANNRRVDMEHDALGRLVKVWQPDRSKAANQSPSTDGKVGMLGT